MSPPISRRCQFSLARLLLATGWLSLAAAAAGQMWRTGLDPGRKWMVILLCGVFWAGITGAVRAITNPLPVRHSFYFASLVLAATAVGIALLILIDFAIQYQL